MSPLPGQGAGLGADSLRAVLDSVFAGRAYRWVERPQGFSRLRHWRDAIVGWLADLDQAHPGTFKLIMIGMLLVVLGVFAHATWVFLRTVRDADRAGGPLPEAGGQRRDRAWYRAEADRLAAAGRYAEAVQADFLALVLALDAWRLLRFHPSKTPAEYGMEAALGAGPRAQFRELIRQLYGYAFARQPCGPADFAEWRANAAPERYAPSR